MWTRTPPLSPNDLVDFNYSFRSRRNSTDSGQKSMGPTTPVPVLAPGWKGQKPDDCGWTYIRKAIGQREPSTIPVWFAYSPDEGGNSPNSPAFIQRTLQANRTRGWTRSTKRGTFQKSASWEHELGSFTINGSRISPPVAVEARTNRETVCDRKRDPGTLTRKTPRDGRTAQPAAAWIVETMGRKLG